MAPFETPFVNSGLLRANGGATAVFLCQIFKTFALFPALPEELKERLEGSISVRLAKFYRSEVVAYYLAPFCVIDYLQLNPLS